MGFAVTLIAAPVGQRDALLASAGVSVTAETDPDLGAPLSAGNIGGHFVIWRNMRAFRSFDLPDGAALSRDGREVMILNVVDTAGAQDLRCYRDGPKVWGVAFSEIYDPMLHVTGPVPVDATAMVTELQAADADSDAEDDPVVYYGAEVPGRVFERLVGAHHERMPLTEPFRTLSGDLPLAEDPTAEDARAALVTPSTGSSRPWWKIW